MKPKEQEKIDWAMVTIFFGSPIVAVTCLLVSKYVLAPSDFSMALTIMGLWIPVVEYMAIIYNGITWDDFYRDRSR